MSIIAQECLEFCIHQFIFDLICSAIHEITREKSLQILCEAKSYCHIYDKEIQLCFVYNVFTLGIILKIFDHKS